MVRKLTHQCKGRFPRTGCIRDHKHTRWTPALATCHPPCKLLSAAREMAKKRSAEGRRRQSDDDGLKNAKFYGIFCKNAENSPDDKLTSGFWWCNDHRRGIDGTTTRNTDHPVLIPWSHSPRQLQQMRRCCLLGTNVVINLRKIKKKFLSIHYGNDFDWLWPTKWRNKHPCCAAQNGQNAWRLRRNWSGWRSFPRRLVTECRCPWSGTPGCPRSPWRVKNIFSNNFKINKI